MLIIRKRAKLGLAEVLAFLYVFVTCLSPPPAVADDHSVTPAAHPGSARRLPNISFRVIEGSNHASRLPAEGDAVSHRRSHQSGINGEENYILRREPVSSYRRYANGKTTEEKGSQISNENHNRNMNSNNGSISTMGQYPHRFWAGSQSQKNPELDTPMSKLERKLQSTVTFRVNIITVFGQLLKASSNRLTVDQYTSLNLILQALAHKQVYMFNVLPVLKQLQNAGRVTQFRLVINALMDNMPPYLTSTCRFWITEIDKRQVDIEKIIATIEYPADFLTGIDPEVIDICKSKVHGEEKEPVDEISAFTKVTLGPVFVNVFIQLKSYQIKLSQKLFAAILASLPVGKINPVLEEYVAFISDAAQENLLPNWTEVAAKIRYGDPYELVSFVIEELLNKNDLSISLKHALQYIFLHMDKLPNAYSDEYYPDMQIILENHKVAEKLISMIPDDITVPEQSDLRDEMIAEIKNINIDIILKGMNKYIYRKPIDLLIAILARMEGRVQKREISLTVKKLISVLVLKEELDSFTETVPANVDLITLLNFLNVPDTDQTISASVQQIQYYLDGDFNLLKNLQNLIPKYDKPKCRRPIQCVLHILEEIVNPMATTSLRIPSNLLVVIKKLHFTMKTAINNSVKCKLENVISVEVSNNLTDVNNNFKPMPQHPVTTHRPSAFLTSPKPTLAHWRPVSIVPTDYKGHSERPDDMTNFPTDRPAKTKPIYPTRSNEKVDRTTRTPYPDRWVEPERGDIFKGKPTRGPIPWPGPMPTRTTEGTPIFEFMQTSKPPFRPAITTPSSWPKTQTVVTSPDYPYPTKKYPVKNEQTNMEPRQPDNEPVLPPNLKFDRPVYVIFPNDDAPPYVTSTKPNGMTDPTTVISFPSIEVLLHDLNPNTPFDLGELPEMPEIFEPLKQTLGLNFVEIILGKRVNKAQYPTVVSLLVDLLNHAVDHPKIIENFKLVTLIRQYLRGIDYISITALFPLIIDSQQIPSNVLYVVFSPDNPNVYSIYSEYPSQVPPGFMTVVIYHPKYWIQQVDPANPYGTLIPNSNQGEDNPIQELIDEGSLPEILGPDFDPLIYPNRATLLTIVLQKLMVSPRVKAKPWLMKKLYAYLKSITTIAMYSKIPENYSAHLIELQRNSEINWQPDTASLFMALPPARNQDELHKINLIRIFLSTPNLLQLLQIPNPSYSTTRGILLTKIFNAVLRGNKLALDPQTLAALKYYENRILMTGHGALPIVWVWVQMFIIREEIPLGEIIEAVIDYHNMPHSVQLSYNSVMTYLSENPQFLQGNDDFPYEKYHTKGTFLRGLFSHLLSKVGISPKTKKHLKKLIPYVSLAGRGSERMNHVTLDDIAKQGIVQDGYHVIVNSY